MPWLGWFIGSRFQKYIEQFDHWIAFGLLAFIGGQMIYESLKEKEEVETEGDQLDIGQLFLMAIATSIDALAIGVTFALLPGVNIWTSIVLIGCTTFMISFAGVGLGFRFGNKYEKKAADRRRCDPDRAWYQDFIGTFRRVAILRERKRVMED